MKNRAQEIEYKRKHHKKRGRPPVITPEVLPKIEYAAGLGCSINEICLYANISSSALYNHFKKYPDFKDYIDLLKDKPILKARETVLKSIENGDDVSARWYLERKRSDEFTVKHDVNISADTSLTIEERSDALDGFLKRFE